MHHDPPFDRAFSHAAGSAGWSAASGDGGALCRAFVDADLAPRFPLPPLHRGDVMTPNADLETRPTIAEWVTLRTFAPDRAQRWQEEVLWCDDCQEWHAPAGRLMTVPPNDGSAS